MLMKGEELQISHDLRVTPDGCLYATIATDTTFATHARFET